MLESRDTGSQLWRKRRRLRFPLAGRTKRRRVRLVIREAVGRVGEERMQVGITFKPVKMEDTWAGSMSTGWDEVEAQTEKRSDRRRDSVASQVMKSKIRNLVRKEKSRILTNSQANVMIER